MLITVPGDLFSHIFNTSFARSLSSPVALLCFFSDLAMLFGLALLVFCSFLNSFDAICSGSFSSLFAFFQRTPARLALLKVEG